MKDFNSQKYTLYSLQEDYSLKLIANMHQIIQCVKILFTGLKTYWS